MTIKKRRSNKEYPILRKTELNNKARKGSYIYVKLKKGIRGRYFREEEGLQPEDYLTVAQGKIEYKRGGIKKLLERPENFEKAIKRRKTVETLLKKGYSETHIKNALTISPHKMKESLKELLKERVKDDWLINILTQDDNIRKYKKRLGYDITLKGNEGQEIAVLSHFGKKTPNDVVKDVKIMIKGQGKEQIEVTDYTSANGTQGSDLSKLAKSKGYSYSPKTNGKVRSVSVKISFRKGK